MRKIILPAIITSYLLTSCVSREKIAYYQNIEGTEIVNKKFETKIKTDDLLMILVSAQDPIAVEPFNLTTNLSVDPSNQAGGGQRQQQLYLVDDKGYIDFPTLGKIEVANKTKDEIVNNLQTKISKYVKNPIINLRIMNYKVTVQGEVKRPGTHKINSERITLLEALALSGDLTNYGKRDNILVLREENGEVTSHRVDLTKADFINSDFYYLKQNDVVYVEPNKVAVNSSAVGPNISIYLSAFSLLLTTVALILTNSNK
ncbi:polysaccharide biosynthesis/export family protein [Flavobacterium sp. CBA20B-1]|uniref:polysaccharide biosynthesis/export family protein n=1 Tax=unclassified Flavobacterium TaxID=196869 RepID=UPI00222551BE|nr:MULTISPECIES: polysaccharide biosynthesis/export family protein [unclassified Flavobacterium]WCM42124.1 polysaccharide biosynthesis/export family protein [Flavobacterium sp. CBA20B-1]